MILYDILDYIHLVTSVLARGWDLCRTGKALARYLTICARYVHNIMNDTANVPAPRGHMACKCVV